MPYKHHHRPEKYYLTIPFEEFPKRFGTPHHPSPRHLTVVSWFKSSHFVDLMGALEHYCADQSPFDITFGPLEPIGDNFELTGQMVREGRERLVALHCGLLGIVEMFGTLNDYTYAGKRYNPHSSVDGHELFTVDAPIDVHSVLVVGKYTKDEHRMNDPDKELSAGFRLGPKPERAT